MIDASVAVQSVTVSTARSVPSDAEAVGFAVGEKGAVPRQLGLSRSALKANGFDGKSGQLLSIPNGDGLLVAVGIGDADDVDANELRRAAASFARAASKFERL
uniref:M17 family peptidase N-terminal domain-containing protein n=1 Tax=Ilumatobacter nonamiensis TaxID=467093 RepID=UPI002409FA75